VTRAIVLALVLLASLTAARADGNAADEAKARFERGQKAYNLGKFRDAIADFEAAYQLDPDPDTTATKAYLFNLAQAYRLDVPKELDGRLANIERALFFYHRFLELGDDSHRADVEARIKQLDDERTQAVAAKAAADKAAADKAAADKLAAQAAAPPKPKHVRIAVDVGTSILFLVGDNDARQSPQLSGRILVAYLRQVGAYTIDLGGSWQLTTLPYRTMLADNTFEAVSANYSQLHGIAAVTRTIVGPVWARAGIGLGIAAFGNLKRDNPIAANGDPSSDIRLLCARIDTVAGYHYNQTIDFVLGLGSASITNKGKELDPRLKRVTTIEGFYLGIYLRL
jgi:tetratricopeptide (TPR) repeat protein